MQLLTWIIVFCLVGGVLSALAAAAFLMLPERQRTRVLPHLVSFATGALLGAAFLALLPHAVSHPAAPDFHLLGLAVLGGLLSFFMLEKVLLWRHCHHAGCDVHAVTDDHRNRAAGALVLVGDGMHNFIDGVLIAAAFLVDVHLGIVTALAVTAHEIPQEVGDLAILLHGGFTPTRAFVLNVLASLTTVVGGVLGYFVLAGAERRNLPRAHAAALRP
ncbi:MAG: ZIP family metal transporter [Xanthomonadaceae bacterium]|nr:ZIP family metal transporter [Xanthomonadaceae bacterium]